MFVTVNWAGQRWGGKVLCLLLRIGPVSVGVGKRCVTVNWAGQRWGGKVLCLLSTVNRFGQCLGWESVVFATVNWAGQCWGGKVLCLLL